MNVLIAEDDPNIRAGLVDILEAEGYSVTQAADGDAALTQWRAHRPDFVLLDIMMPGQNGYDVCRGIRQEDQQVPIIFISAKSEEIDRVLGLELGADDFIQKPFGVKEVIARIRAVTRRTLRTRGPEPTRAEFSLGDLHVSPAELRARRGEQAIDLSLRDVKILQLLHRERGRVVDREQFFRDCWGYNHLPNSRTLDQHISKLRRRIEVDPKAPAIIRTVHGVGYRFEE
jgi:DNA-binding response OmpR family regulator